MIRRIGGLETYDRAGEYLPLMIRRIGGLENITQGFAAFLLDDPPHRRLRKLSGGESRDD